MDITVLDVGFDPLEGFAGELKGLLVVDHHVHGHFVFEEEAADLCDGRGQGLILGEAVGPRGDQWKGDGLALQVLRQGKRVPVAACHGLPLPAVAALPDGAHRVDDVFRIQSKGRGRRSLPPQHGADLGALRQKIIPAGSLVNRIVRAGTHRHFRIGSVDDGIRPDLGYVVSDDF